MSQNKYITPSEKYNFISSQHGGYFRHDFIDHAYLYNLYFPPQDIFTNFKEQIYELVLNYPVAQDALAELVGHIIHQPTERIVVGNGAAELIKIVSGHIANKVIVPVPSFNEYANAAPAGNVVEFPLEFPSFQLDVKKFAEKALKVKADVAVVVTPNNPTSMIVPKPNLIWLVKKLATQNCKLIVDESFLDFADNSEHLSLEQDLEQHPNLVIFKSMSKAYGICGLRIGYMLSANSEFVQSVKNGVHIWNINGFAEQFLRLLPDYKKEFVESCSKVRFDRDRLYKKLCAIDNLTVYKPDANFVFCRLPDDSESAPIIVKKLFIEHNMYIKDCVGKTQPDSDRYLRIASRTEVENSNLVEALLDVLHTNKRKVKNDRLQR